MRTATLAVALAVSGPAPAALAQHTLDWPVEELVPYESASGLRANPGDTAHTVFVDIITFRGAGWLRLYFDQVDLAPGSYVRMTSLLDGEVQALDGRGLAMWDYASAYFNGDTVLVELVAAPGSIDNAFSIGQIARPNGAVPVGDGSQCGICGSDQRTPSNELWTSRLLPAGCTASVYSPDSCMVSAGHCIGGSMVVQFNVPPSNGNCSINHPPVSEQFPITSSDQVNGGVGNDWSVLVPGLNSVGEQPYDRYGELRPIAGAPAPLGAAVNVWGYGVDNTCVNSQTQQTSGGTISFVGGSHYEFNVDIRGGNSGSALIRNGEIIGIVTHCSFGCPNFATRVDVPAFAGAIATCGQPDCPGTGDCCQANGTPGCSDQGCCETVCACDPFCCDVEWDEFCAGEGFNGSGCGAAILCGCGGGPEEAPNANFAVVKGTLVSGALADLDDSDDTYVSADSEPNNSGNRQLTEIQVNATSPHASVSQLEITIEVGVDVAVNSMRIQLRLRNWTTNKWDRIDRYSQNTTDDVSMTFVIANPNDYIRDTNQQIRGRIRAHARANQAPSFTSRIDHFEALVTP